MSDSLSQLGKVTVLVADTGDIEAIRKYQPQDATTNPSLLLKAAVMDEYKDLVADAISYGKSNAEGAEVIKLVMDKLAVNFGAEITKIVKGVVSTEVDARLSFNTQGTIDKALQLIKLYSDLGIGKERILIKIASTWEGIRAAEVLQRDHGITCNMTLLFSLVQAVACAEAGATLISPFVGRITDWFKASTGTKEYSSEEDPGVLSVRNIYNYYKQKGYKTIVMGASFRNPGQITALAGCDKLTIAPKLLDMLKASNDDVPVKLSAEESKNNEVETIGHDENTFRWLMNEDPMATEKLAHGIRSFAADSVKLETILLEKIASS